MTARCETCGALLHWRAQRGTRLADFRCTCGGRFKAVAQDGSPITRHPRPRAGRVACVLDGRRRMMPGPTVYRSPFEFAVPLFWDGLVQLVRRGDPVCWYHDLEPVIYA